MAGGEGLKRKRTQLSKMKIPVLVEPLEDGRFRATAAPPFTSVGERITKDEALANIRSGLEIELFQDKRIVMIEVGAAK